ncbi:MAG: hypothetical protein AAB074_22800 [Planctomycetota bacterium]
MTPVQLYSTVVLALIAAGLAFRRRRRIHIPIMLGAFALDLGSVVYLQVQRNAVQKAAAEPTTILMVHIAFALSALLLYTAMTVTGTKLARRGTGRPMHRGLACVFLVCRVSTWGTSFFVG